MKHIINYDDYKINEGFFQKVMRGIGKWASAPLNDFINDLRRDGDPKSVAKSLRDFISLNGKNIDNALQKIKDKNQLKTYLSDSLISIASALKAVQATQKIDQTFFDEIFRKADRRLIKAMSNNDDKKLEQAVRGYVDTILMPNLEKISKTKNIGENTVYEELNMPSWFNRKQQNKNQDKKDQNNQNQDNQKDQNDQNDNQKGQDNKNEPISDGLKEVTKKWMLNILRPILDVDKKIKNVNKGKKIIYTKNQSPVRRKVIQDIVSNADIKDVIDFRNRVAKERGIDPKRWGVGK